MNSAAPARASLAYCDARGRIFFDERTRPLADGGVVRPPLADELIPAPAGTVEMVLPGRRPLAGDAVAPRASERRNALAVALPAGYTRLLLPAYRADPGAPPLPLFGYTFACELDDRLHVAAARTDEHDDWRPRYFARGELETAIARRRERDPGNAVLAQLAVCAREYGCFTAQNVFLERGEAALPVSPTCNARCLGCISELDADAGIPSPQRRIDFEATAEALARIALAHLERVPDGVVSFGQGCEGEPLLRIAAIERAIERIRGATQAGTVNLNTNGSLPRSLQRAIDAGLQAVRISLNSFRPHAYAAYYRPLGYALEDVLESARIASRAGLRVSLNLLTHPGVTDDEQEVAAANEFLSSVRVDMVQTRTLNVDPQVYFDAVGRPARPLGMRFALDALALRTQLGNFTHTH
ncbi:MAG: radical SAM protein [Candidatus Eremiobacteraeota bacterium]|nr:radical SAM protein [Candidatus Eremiobacteraeota bacterium]